jgi:hypothetical protein
MNPYLVLFECLVCCLFMGCLWDAWRKQGKFFVLELMWTGLYGYLLEWLTIKQLHAYQYGTFLVMIDGAPLAIALAWAVIIYASMRFSASIQLPDVIRPLLDALLALNIDLAFDTVAIRLGMWVWTGVAFDKQWFGVPWANFWAWFVVVWSYSTCLRLFRPWQSHTIRRWLYVPLAMVLSLLVLVVSNELFRFMSDTSSHALATIFLVAGSLVMILKARPRSVVGSISSRIPLLVPAAFHSFGLAAGLSAGFYVQYPALAVIGIVMLALSLSLHLSPSSSLKLNALQKRALAFTAQAVDSRNRG